MLSEIFEKDRWMRIAYGKLLKSPIYNPHIINRIDLFLESYAEFYKLSLNDIISIYNNFTNYYSKDIRQFLQTGKYPFELDVKRPISRVDYDIVLILSVVLSEHRHRIFNQLILSSKSSSSDVALIGVGSGLEIEFLNRQNNRITAYDISISDFAKTMYTDIKMVESYFDGTQKNFSIIYAIELLEHLSDPITFLKMIYESMIFGGQFFFTTATNVPQIDHLANFPDMGAFESKLKQIGFKTENNIEIVHDSIDSKLKASNNWFEVKK
jgi:hypothetical protein